MYKYLQVTMILMSIALVGCTRKLDPVPEASQIPKEGNFLKGTSDVVKEGTNYYAVGYFLAKPIKSSSRGLIFDTNEIEVNIGAFGGQFIGNTVPVSIEDDGLAQEFNKLDQDFLYVFKYERPHRLNPEIEDTHYHIRSWEPLNKNISFEYEGVESFKEKRGQFSKGVRQGKVVWAERWGYWDIDCTVTILMGGIKRGKENLVEMNTYSEEACAFAEKSLKAGVDVSFEYSEDYVEIWDSTPYILHKIAFAKTSGDDGWKVYE